MNSDTDIYLLGANGFIGKEIYCYLEKMKLDIIPVTRSGEVLNSDSEINITDFFDRLDQTSDKSIIVINTVGKAHVRKEIKANNIETFLDANVNFCKVLGNKIKASKVKKLIHLSSISARTNLEVLQDFVYDYQCKPLNSDPYSKSKRMGERELIKALQDSCTSLIILRPVMVYGKYAPGNFRSLVRIIKTQLPLPFKSFNNQKSFLSGQNLGSFVHNCIERETFDRKSVAVADHNNNSVSDFIENLYTALGIRNNSFYMPNLLLKIFFMIIGKKHVFDKLTEDLNVNMDELVNSHGWTPYETQEIALERIFKDRKLNG